MREFRMKTFRNLAGIVIYERETGYCLAIQTSKGPRYAALFHSKTNIYKRSFYETRMSDSKIVTSNEIFPELHKRIEKNENN